MDHFPVTKKKHREFKKKKVGKECCFHCSKKRMSYIPLFHLRVLTLSLVLVCGMRLPFYTSTLNNCCYYIIYTNQRDKPFPSMSLKVY